MTHKEKVSIALDTGIIRALDGKDPDTRIKALLGIKNVVSDYTQYLELLIGEQVALIEINKQQGK